MTQKVLNMVKEWVKYWKVFDDRYVFTDGQFYLIAMAVNIQDNNICELKI
jgi:hypothetical protein